MLGDERVVLADSRYASLAQQLQPILYVAERGIREDMELLYDLPYDLVRTYYDEVYDEECDDRAE